MSQSAARTAVATYYIGRFQPLPIQVTGAIRFKGVHLTEDEKGRNGESGGKAGKGKFILSALSVRQIKEMAKEFVEALNGKKGPIFLATTALSLYSTYQIAKDSMPDELGLSEGDIIDLLEAAIDEQISSVINGFSIEELTNAAAQAMTDPGLIAALMIRLLVPSFGWAATLYEIVDNFQYIKAAVELAWYAFDDPDSSLGAAVQEINKLLDNVVSWAEWFGIEFKVDDEATTDTEGQPIVDQDFGVVQDDLGTVGSAFTGTAPGGEEDQAEETVVPDEVRGQSSADIVPSDVSFDGVMRILPDPLAENVAIDTNLYVLTYLTHMRDRRQEFTPEEQAAFGDLGGNMALFGYDTNDALWGGLYNDALYGGDGDDNLMGSPGDDYMIGGKEGGTGSEEGGTGSEEGGDTGERYGDTVTYDLTGEFGILDKAGEQQTFEFDKIHLRLGDSQYHVQAAKFFKDGSSGVDRMAGIESIILASKSDIVEIVDGSKDFISVLWKLYGGTNGEEGDTGEIKITGSESIRSVSLFNGTGYMSDALLKDVPEVSEFRSFEPGDIETAAKKFAQPVEGGAPVPTTWSKKAERPEDALGYVELEEFDADITGGEAGEILWSTDDIKRLVQGNEGDDTISVGDTRSKDIVQKEGKSQALGGAGDDIIVVHGALTEGRGGEGDDVVVGVSLDDSNSVELTVAGDEGNDTVQAFGGEGAIAIGGVGDDWVYNTSSGGLIYGDTRMSDGSGSGNQGSDLIWWAPGVTMKDPDETDFLRYFDRPLIGGTENLPFGGINIILDAVVPVSSLATYKTEVFYDYTNPNIQYQMVDGEFFVVNRLPGVMTSGNASWEGSGGGASNLPDPGTSMRFQNFEQKSSLWGVAFLEGFEDGTGINAWSGLRAVTSGNVSFNGDVGGDLGMFFKESNPVLDIVAWIPGFPGGLTRWIPMIEHVLVQAGAKALRATNLKWGSENDPLVVDLDGDGIETSAIGDTTVHFDFDGDFFAERTGWLDADDGFLVLDSNDDGLISDVTEMFGGPGLSGFAELRDHDLNVDGVITIDDAVYAQIQIWRDLDQDGETDEGELFSLEELGVVSLDVWGVDMGDFVTPDRAQLLREGAVTFADGSVSRMFDAIFDTSETFTTFRGEIGVLEAPQLQSRGYGNLVNLDVAMTNDLELSEIANAAADNMTVIDMRTLRAQVGETLSLWSLANSTTRELAPVRIGDVDGTDTVLDRAVWTEDETAGFWQLASGTPVLDAEGVEIARPVLEDILAQGADWQVAQLFSPATRAEALQHRVARPFLVEVIDGVAHVRDWGEQNEDGSWRLASGNAVLDADGLEIAAPTLEDITAQHAGVGLAWRTEEFGFNDLNTVAVEEIGVRQVDGIVTDYTVEITDENGSFYVWARNVDRALELQAKYGTAREYNLRNYEIDFDTLDEVNSTDDSAWRVEILTPGQMNFALASAGFEFQPEMLSGTYDNDTGILAYTVSPAEDTGTAGEDGYVSGITKVIDLLKEIVPDYITTANGYAVRMALQGGLSEFAQGIVYDEVFDVYRPTTDEELIPVFDAIFKALPADQIEATEYLQAWSELLSQIVPDYTPDGSNNDGGQSVRADKVFVLQNLIAAWERNPSPLDLREAMYAMQLDQDKLRLPSENADEYDYVAGSNAIDYFYLEGGDQTLAGGNGDDAYFTGEQTGHDVITDYDDGDDDDLRLTGVTPDDVTFERDGQDLLITWNEIDKSVRITDHFLGELNPLVSGGRRDSGVNHVVFGDGTVWDRFQISLEVSREEDTNDVIIGSGSADVLRGGLGNDVMRGGAGGDYYYYNLGGGQDVVGEETDFWSTASQAAIGPLTGGVDYLYFGEGVRLANMHFVREADGDDLTIVMLDDEGNETGDKLTIEKQFWGMRNPIPGALGEFDPSLEFDYVSPFMIERFVFDGGASIDIERMMQLVLQQAATDGDDAIYGFINDNELQGGAGDDFLTGLEGGDTYFFGRGDGEDVILDNDMSVIFLGEKPDDKLVFTDDLRWTDFDFIRDGASDTLRMMVKGTTDGVVLTDFLEVFPFIGFINRIEQFTFGDGTVWGWDKLLQHYVNIAKTDGDDTIYGFNVADFIDGGLGDDRLVGMGGGDIYVFEPLHGSDTILDSGGIDRVEMRNIGFDDVEFDRTALDLIIRLKSTGEELVLENQYVRESEQGFAVEDFVFSDGTLVHTDVNPEDIDLIGTNGAETIYGSNFSEKIDGLAGDDLLVGRDGGDTYVFDAGYGNDTIDDVRERAYWKDRRHVPDPVRDTVELGGDITRDNIIFTRDGFDLVITIEERPDTLRIRDQFKSSAHGVERLKFFDGSIMTMREVEQNLNIEGGTRGDDILQGVIDQENVLDGRQGDDVLQGGRLADSYAFGAEYDLDRIEEQTDRAGVIDRVIFGATVDPESVLLRRDGDTLIIDLGNGTDVLTIVDGLGAHTVELFEFAGGVEWTLDDVRGRLLIGSDGDDQLIGFNGRDDVLAGGAGSDAMEGRTGNDTYEFGYGDGHDSAFDTGGIDKVVFGTGIDQGDVLFTNVNGDLVATLAGSEETLVVLGGAASGGGSNAIESFEFGNGAVLSLEDVQALIIGAQSNADMDKLRAETLGTEYTLQPGRGFDHVTLDDNATMVFNKGDGIDTVWAGYQTTGSRIIFTDLFSTDAEVRVTRVDGDDLIVAFPETGDQVILTDARASSYVPVLEFADGVVWDRAGLINALIETQATDGDDLLLGSALDEILEGGLGNDDLRGGTGSDTYLFTRGDGRDVITDPNGTDVLQIEGYLYSDMEIRRPLTAASGGTNDIILTFDGSDDEIVLRYSDSFAGIEKVTFGDGTEITREQMVNMTAGAGTEFDDLIIGTSLVETIVGGDGNDTMNGTAGNDIFIINRGDGRDFIDESGSSRDSNQLWLPDHLPEQVKVINAPADSSYDGILDLGNGQRVMLEYGLRSSSARVSEVVFADDTRWNTAELAARANAHFNRVTVDVATLRPGLEEVVATGASEYLEGGGLPNTYVFARGSAQDRLEDDGVGNTLRLDGYSMAEARFAPSDSSDSRDLLLTFTGTDDRLVIVDGLAYDFYGEAGEQAVSTFVFDDGTLNIGEIAQGLIDAQISTGDDLIEGIVTPTTIEGAQATTPSAARSTTVRSVSESVTGRTSLMRMQMTPWRHLKSSATRPAM